MKEESVCLIRHANRRSVVAHLWLVSRVTRCLCARPPCTFVPEIPRRATLLTDGSYLFFFCRRIIVTQGICSDSPHKSTHPGAQSVKARPRVATARRAARSLCISHTATLDSAEPTSSYNLPIHRAQTGAQTGVRRAAESGEARRDRGVRQEARLPPLRRHTFIHPPFRTTHDLLRPNSNWHSFVSLILPPTSTEIQVSP